MKGFLYKLIAIFLIIFFSGSAIHAQNELNVDKNLDQYNYDHWTSEQGLPVNSIIHIIQARTGYIWFVSYGGITRFNGIDFYTYSSFNTPAIQNNSYTHIYEDRSGIIWASSSGAGVTAIDGEKIKIYDMEDGLPGNFVQEVVADLEGTLWVATDNGLYYKEGERFLNEDTPGELKDVNLTSIDCSQDGYLWVGTVDKGVYRFKGNDIQRYDMSTGLTSNHINYVKCEMGAVFIGTDGGMSVVEGGGIRRMTTEEGLLNNYVTSSEIDNNDILWVGTYKGFTRVDDDRYSYFSKVHPLFGQDVTSMVMDNEGNLWLGTYRQGLYKLWDGKFTNYSDLRATDQKPYVVHAIVERSTGEYLVVHQEGVSILNAEKNTLQPLNLGYDFSSTNLKSGFLDSRGNLWISTLNFLLKYNGGEPVIYNTGKGLIHDNVRLVFEDSKENIWVGTTDGITVINKNEQISYSVENGLSHEYIMSIDEDSDGNIWIGTRNGLNVFKDGKFTSFYARDGLAGDFVFRTVEDSDGVRWICGNAGLTRYKNGEFKKVLATNGLTSNTIFQLIEDDFGYYWFTTNQKGISVFKVRKSELNDFLEGRIDRVTSVAYSQEDGLKATAATSSAQSLKAKDGTLWFATNRGVEMIDPGNIKLNARKPPVAIEKVLIDNKPVTADSLITIPAGKHRITIKFAALSYIAPHSITYKYKLSGFDDDWQESQDKKEISYTNLPYGNYSFQVLAANRDGIWNDEGAVLSFYIKPAFYETNAFAVMAILIVVSLIWLVYYLRIRSLKNAQQELARIVAVRTSEITHQKEEIEAQKEAIEAQQRQIEDKNKELQKINLRLEDIVEERTDQLKKAYKELLEVNKELDTFIYRSVHDVRGPIARLQGLSHLISLETADQKILELVNLLNVTAEEMNDVFYRLLNIVRLKASELNINEVNVGKLIDRVLDRLLPNARNEVQVSIDIEEGCQLFSDKETVENIFYQLLDNAIKFKKENEVPRIEIRCRKMKGQTVSIQVTDYGLGIPKDITTKIFDMFFVGHDEISGSGLGLYTVKTAVKVLNGKIHLVNDEEGKTTFEIILPANA
ncbi:hypothetical protein C900_03307 [Fulvivirga imtechensis AK7]|uniref:histidine kinase n=1 Tax=Fulvivirga imtechensis AK7 TaxID=1237149 RepID=L8JUA3_9BACT|nr:sensor histidine kinase [Fulvivirga imtechensis]ELR70872.1 hypothetical protein C900_03307 [Fulvivirga imtechensis AK7]